MGSLLKDRLLEVLKAVLPLVGFICLLQAVVVRAPLELFLQFLAGSLLATLGMVLLFVGIELGILPMGRFIGAELPKKGSITLIIGVTFALGFATTVAEPDVLILAGQVDAVFGGALSGQVVLYAIAVGVAAFAAVAMGRIIAGWPIQWPLTIAYALVIVLSLMAPERLAPLAFDAGSVTTGVLSAPVVIALGIGLSSVLAGRSAVADGFGLLGLASVGPVIIILLIGTVM